eukprot:g16979.t1
MAYRRRMVALDATCMRKAMLAIAGVERKVMRAITGMKHGAHHHGCNERQHHRPRPTQELRYQLETEVLARGMSGYQPERNVTAEPPEAEPAVPATDPERTAENIAAPVVAAHLGTAANLEEGDEGSVPRPPVEITSGWDVFNPDDQLEHTIPTGRNETGQDGWGDFDFDDLMSETGASKMEATLKADDDEEDSLSLTLQECEELRRHRELVRRQRAEAEEARQKEREQARMKRQKDWDEQQRRIRLEVERETQTERLESQPDSAKLRRCKEELAAVSRIQAVLSVFI